MLSRKGCVYKSLSTAAGAGVVVSTAPAWLFGFSAYCKTTGATQVVIYDATATATGTIIAGTAAANTASACANVNFQHPVKMDTGIYASVIAGTAASDYVTVYYSLA